MTSSPSLKFSPFTSPWQKKRMRERRDPILFSVSQPLFSAPSSFPPFFNPATPLMFFSCVFLLPVLAQRQNEADRGLASCISHMHYSCALQSVCIWVFRCLSLGHMGLMNKLCVPSTGPDGRAAQMGLLISWFLLMPFQNNRVRGSRSTLQTEAVSLDKIKNVVSVSPNSCNRFNNLVCFSSQTRDQLRFQLNLPWCRSERLALFHSWPRTVSAWQRISLRIQRLSSLLLECAQ